MKAVVIKSPGNIVVEEYEMPSQKQGEVLLKVSACAICGTDQRVFKGEKHVDVPIVGHEISGIVVEVGQGVSGIGKDERYAVQTVIGCGTCPMCKISRENLCENGFKAIGYQWNGGFAEYMIIPKTGVDQGCLIPVSDEMSDEVATLLEPLSCCINGMRIIPLEEAQSVVVFGGCIIGVLNGLVSMSPLGIDWTHMNVELLEMTAFSLIQAIATGKKIKTLSKEEVRNLDNVVQKRDCPMFGAPGVHSSLVDLYFPEEKIYS